MFWFIENIDKNMRGIQQKWDSKSDFKKNLVPWSYERNFLCQMYENTQFSIIWALRHQCIGANDFFFILGHLPHKNVQKMTYPKKVTSEPKLGFTVALKPQTKWNFGYSENTISVPHIKIQIFFCNSFVNDHQSKFGDSMH